MVDPDQLRARAEQARRLSKGMDASETRRLLQIAADYDQEAAAAEARASEASEQQNPQAEP